MNSSLKKWLFLLLKIAVTTICLLYVIKKIDWATSWATFQRSNVFWLIAATLLIFSSKVVAAFRLNIYFKNINVFLSNKNNLRLYWLGMYYNVFLPGGVGGDGYKVFVLNKTYQHPVKLLTAAVLLDRVSGVAGIGVLTAAYYFGVFGGENYSWWLLASVLPGLFIYYFIVKIFFPSFIKSFWSTFWMGLAVQSIQVISVYCLLNALHLKGHDTEYILIFLLSSLVAFLPFTIGGFGAREVVFIWGSKQFVLNQSESVCISLLFYLISVAISLPGMYWVYNKALKEENKEVIVEEKSSYSS
ncbi:flippase-like domain-containing protein [Ilyomonas limi]|uniref:Flippase-like domain-containing protein n=1 Tax=Ilyomonas limi TaxID=2575867 RepID=A0A4U3LAQ0_9BACT|nr:lysylphosphatidylglycerol synthase transmembrane domain-containing protein [Ilyomonas limi]TKK71779.1 flippase-like domain-containing protein [Ilyomonas limi]